MLTEKEIGKVWQAIGYLEEALLGTLVRAQVRNAARGNADLIGAMAQLALCLNEIVEEAQSE